MVPASILTYARLHPDPQPWKKTYSYSAFGHAALVCFFMLLAVRAQRPPATILTEVQFIRTEAAVVPMVVPDPSSAKATPTPGEVRAPKGAIDLESTGRGPVRVQDTRPMPAGDINKPNLGGNIPLSGPIVASEPVGWVGRKTGALVELPSRQGGTMAKGLKDEKESAGSLGEPAPLSRMGLDEVRRQERSIGAPLISQSVVSGSLSGKTKDLIGLATPAEKRRAAEENLKANPLDKDKWGKQKGPFSIEGPLKYRKILKMELPPYPRWAEEKALEASVSIRLWVSPNGKVIDNMYLERTSGYAELDRLAMEALNKFLFVTLPENQAQEDEWGVATFRFELKK
jgi:TonB family protein